VPEIYDGIIEIKSVARDPGSRAKIAVISRDCSIDPVGACVGMRGSARAGGGRRTAGREDRHHPVDARRATFIVNALQPAEVAKVVLDEEAERIEVVVPDEQLSLAIGRRGQNVRLASQLTGWDIDILTEQKRASAARRNSPSAPSCSWRPSTSTRRSASCWPPKASPRSRNWPMSTGEIASIEGFDERRRRNPAKAFLEREAAEMEEKRKALGVADDLAIFEGLSPRMVVALGEAGVKSLEDFADLATDELTGWNERKNGETVKHKGYLSEHGVTAAEAEGLILQARVALGWIEAPAVEADAEAEAEQDA
jgi:N utilization substance protein A